MTTPSPPLLVPFMNPTIDPSSMDEHSLAMLLKMNDYDGPNRVIIDGGSGFDMIKESQNLNAKTTWATRTFG